MVRKKQVFYTSDYNDWKLCSYEGEDSSCSDQYAVDLNVGKYHSRHFSKRSYLSSESSMTQ